MMLSIRTQRKKRLQEIEALEVATAKKWRRLNSSKAFIIETAKLTSALEKALVRRPRYVKRFFRRFGYPIGRLKAIRDYLSSAPDQQTKTAIAAYLPYVVRFGVLLKCHRKTLRFVPYPLAPWGTTFHVRLTNGRFLPAGPYPGGDEPYVHYFESDPKRAPHYLQQLIESGGVKFVEIDDRDGSSLLTQLELFAYSPETVTLVIHRAEQPYLFCLVGENVTHDAWRDINKAVTAFQRMLAGRSRAGRPPDITRLKRTLHLFGKFRLKKDLAHAIKPKGKDSAKDTYSAQSYVSRVGHLVRPK